MDITFPLFACISGALFGAFIALMCTSAREKKPHYLGTLFIIAAWSGTIAVFRLLGYGNLETSGLYTILLFFVFAVVTGWLAYGEWREYEEGKAFH